MVTKVTFIKDGTPAMVDALKGLEAMWFVRALLRSGVYGRTVYVS